MIAEPIQLIALLVTVVGVIFAMLGYVSTQSKNLREVISSGDRAASEAASKQRHDLANQLHMLCSTMRADIETLKRETVRKDEVTAMDNRWSSNFIRLEAKLDRVAEQLSQVAALEVSIRSCSEQLATVAKRLDAREGRGA